MDTPNATHETGAPATSSDEGPKRYRVTIEMTQVFTEEIEIEADTAGQAWVKAEEMISAEALGHLEFQDLQSTSYQVGRVVRLS